MTDNPAQPGSRHLPVDVFPSLPVCWAALTDAEAEEEHEALADWIAWLIDRHTLDHRPYTCGAGDVRTSAPWSFTVRGR